MKKRQQADILGAQVDLINSAEALDKIRHYIDQRHPAHIITLNAEIVYQAQKNPQLMQIINDADMVTPDGIGIVWGGRRLGYPFAERVSGIDLLYLVCEQATQEKWSVYLLGAAPGVAEAAARRLSATYPGLDVCGTHHGYFDAGQEQEIIENIKQRPPDILFVALGAPGQEYWISRFKSVLQVPVAIGVGGSFDVIAGLKSRAPEWMIKANLEWMYRLLKEPSRFKRQSALPKFAFMVLQRSLFKKLIRR